MFPVPLIQASTTLTRESFWNSVLLYHNRPHLVNRKLLAASQLLFYKVNFHSPSIKHINELFTRSAILYEIRKLKSFTKQTICESFLLEFLTCFDKNVTLKAITEDEFKEQGDGIVVSVRILLPKKGPNDCIEIVVLDKNRNTAVFSAVSLNDSFPIAPPFPYEVELSSSANLRINLQNYEDANTMQASWIADNLFGKLFKWAESGVEFSNTSCSLSLISVDDYHSTYARIKEKYGDHLLNEWPKKTNTDPKKYVFEDLAIASYLICLWKDYDKEDIDFVDCGCGNGLLVYILNQEGYKGYGIDIRSRATWDIYPAETHLEVGTVTPSSLFPTSTWIIGNHSDELTPWIPVIAMKSSPRTNIFVIPCCPYDFSGQKYARTNTSVSQYSDYLHYVTKIYNMCGFNTRTDKLRIPSTKRTCLVGIRKSLSGDEVESLDVNTFIESRLSSSGFKARSNIEAVRNCTQLNRDLIQNLLLNCVNCLLADKSVTKKANGDNWNKGGALTLSSLSQLIAKSDLKLLKEQCGGLQTLLRNHRYLFELVSGEVRLREPPLLSEETMKYKGKMCWFWKNHPDGCLHSSENCSFQHGELLM